MIQVKFSGTASASSARTRAVNASAGPRGSTSPTISFSTGCTTTFSFPSSRNARCTCGSATIFPAMSSVMAIRSTPSSAVLRPDWTAPVQPDKTKMQKTKCTMQNRRARTKRHFILHSSFCISRLHSRPLARHLHLVFADEDLLARVVVGDDEVEQVIRRAAIGHVGGGGVKRKIGRDRTGRPGAAAASVLAELVPLELAFQLPVARVVEAVL